MAHNEEKNEDEYQELEVPSSYEKDDEPEPEPKEVVYETYDDDTPASGSGKFVATPRIRRPSSLQSGPGEALSEFQEERERGTTDAELREIVSAPGYKEKRAAREAQDTEYASFQKRRESPADFTVKEANEAFTLEKTSRTEKVKAKTPRRSAGSRSQNVFYVGSDVKTEAKSEDRKKRTPEDIELERLKIEKEKFGLYRSGKELSREEREERRRARKEEFLLSREAKKLSREEKVAQAEFEKENPTTLRGKISKSIDKNLERLDKAANLPNRGLGATSARALKDSVASKLPRGGRGRQGRGGYGGSIYGEPRQPNEPRGSMPYGDYTGVVLEGSDRPGFIKAKYYYRGYIQRTKYIPDQGQSLGQQYGGTSGVPGTEVDTSSFAQPAKPDYFSIPALTQPQQQPQQQQAEMVPQQRPTDLYGLGSLSPPPGERAPTKTFRPVGGRSTSTSPNLTNLFGLGGMPRPQAQRKMSAPSQARTTAPVRQAAQPPRDLFGLGNLGGLAPTTSLKKRKGGKGPDYKNLFGL